MKQFKDTLLQKHVDEGSKGDHSSNNTAYMDEKVVKTLLHSFLSHRHARQVVPLGLVSGIVLE